MFQKAERKKAKLRMSFAGLSGSGKTKSSLMIASGLFPNGKIAMINSEGARGEIYASEFDYDINTITAPFSVTKYIDAIKDAERMKYDVLIIDSLSHAWAGDGGALSVVEAGGGWFNKGGQLASKQQHNLVDTIISSPLHIIITLRSKAEYVSELNEKGKQQPRKIGLAPVQRDGLEYEMIIAADIDLTNIAHFTKDNTALFNQQFIIPSREMGKKIMEWLNEGTDEKQKFALLIPAIEQELYNTQSIKELAQAFGKYYIKYNHYDIFSQIISAKDAHKADLENMEKMALMMEESPESTNQKYHSTY